MTGRNERFRAFYLTYRIDDQKVYYKSRRDEYRTAHMQALTVRNVFFALSALAGGAGQFVAGTARAGAGVVAATLAALAGVVTGYEALIGFPSLAKIYHDAWLGLDAAQDDWETPADDLTEPLLRAEQVLRSENGQWGQLAVQQATEAAADHAIPGQPDRSGS